MGSFAFWSPVLRAWFSAMPYFIVGFGGLILQMERMRQTRDKKIDAQTADIKAHVDDQFADLKTTLANQEKQAP